MLTQSKKNPVSCNRFPVKKTKLLSFGRWYFFRMKPFIRGGEHEGKSGSSVAFVQPKGMSAWAPSCMTATLPLSYSRTFISDDSHQIMIQGWHFARQRSSSLSLTGYQRHRVVPDASVPRPCLTACRAKPTPGFILPSYQQIWNHGYVQNEKLAPGFSAYLFSV